MSWIGIRSQKSEIRVRWLVVLGMVGVVLGMGGGLSAGTYSGGAGTAEDPYQIADANDLLELGATTADYDKHFVITADIDLEGYSFTAAVIAPDVYDDANHFQGTPFNGVFEGNGHTILHLAIEGGENLGLFGQLESLAEVRNLRVVDVHITGSHNGAGGLASSNAGSISTCCSTGSVSGANVIGGLVGHNTGSITDSYSSSIVTGYEELGGLVGLNDRGSITSCHSRGMVTGDDNVGGLVGENQGSIAMSFSNSTVTGDGEGIGGLVGFQNEGSITVSYSSGMVTGGNFVGGLVGRGVGTIITMSYWDVDASNKPNMCGDQDFDPLFNCDNSYGKTTAEMMQQSTFEDWDFINTWGIGEGQTYPYLRKYSAADINQDGIVNLLDFSLLAEQWMSGL